MERVPSLVDTKILVLRHPAEATIIRDSCTQLGAIVHAVPAIKILPISTGLSQITPTLLQQVDVVIFTSKHAIQLIFNQPNLPQQLENKIYVAVGPSTAETLITNGIRRECILVPTEYNADGIIQQFRSKFSGQMLLYPKSEAASPYLSGMLAGFSLIEIAIYRPSPIPIAITSVTQYDYIVITSSSIAHSFFSQYPPQAYPPTYIAMGEQTAQAIRPFASEVIVASPSTQAGVVSSILTTHSKKRRLS
jgi:uroporphyrinogen-III synthase